MPWKTALALCLSATAQVEAQGQRSESALETFATDSKDVRDRVKLEGKPTIQQLDALLPPSAISMFRIVLLCDVSGSGNPMHCRRDKKYPDQSGEVSVALKALEGTRVSTADTHKIKVGKLKFQAVVYLDDPTRVLDRFDIWAVPTPPPPPPPAQLDILAVPTLLPLPAQPPQ